VEKLKKRLIHNFLFVLLFFSGTGARASLFDSSPFGESTSYIKSWVESASGFKSLAEGTKVVEQALNRDVKDWRIKQIAQIDELLKKIREEKTELLKKLEADRKQLDAELAKHRHVINNPDAAVFADDSLKKLVRIYEERQQILMTSQTLCLSMTGFVEEYLGLLQHHSDEVIYSGVDLLNKIVYKIDEYSYVENQIEIVDEQIKEVEDARKKIDEERIRYQGTLGALYKESAAKERELRSKDSKIDPLQAEYDLLKEKERLLRLRLEKNGFEKSKADDEANLLKFQKIRLAELLIRARRNLAIDSDDITRAKVEKEAHDAMQMAERSRIESIRNEKEMEYERARQRHETTKNHLSSLRAVGREGTAEGIVLQARELLDKNICSALTARLASLDLDINFASVELALKEFSFRALEMRFKLASEDVKITEWIEDLALHKEQLERDAKALSNRKNKANSALPKMQEEIDRLKKKQLELSGGSSGQFVGHDESLKNALHYLFEAKEAVKAQIAHTQRFEVRAAELLRLYQRAFKRYVSLLGELEAKRVSVDIWRRSSRGLSMEMLLRANEEFQSFGRDFLVKVRALLDINILLTGASLGLFAALLLFFAAFVVLRFILRFLLLFARRRLQLFISYQKGTFVFWYLNVVLLFFDAALRQFSLLFPLLFVYVHMWIPFDYFGMLKFTHASFLLIAFYAATIVVLVHTAADFISELRVLNARLSYFFFSERSQRRILLLLNLLFYSSAISIPLRAAFIAYDPKYDFLPTLIFAVYSLAVTVVLAFFFEKDDFINLVSGRSPFWLNLRQAIDDYFYPVFAFALSLCLLSNPYVGYVRLASYLAMYLPISLAAIWLAARLYEMLRNQVLWIFIEERDDELVERFEHAKVYYGYFVTTSFFLFVLFVAGGLSRILGLKYGYGHLWTLLSEEWLVRAPFTDSAHVYVGFLEAFYLYTFWTGGYLASTCLNKFILAKVFEVFGTEPGAQNTYSRILHVAVLIFSLLLGLIYIRLGQLASVMTAALILIGGFGAKDLVADFVAGLLILLERQIEIGHYITADSMRGTVHKISARSTIIRTQQNYFVVIPNRTLISHSIVNWGAGRFSVGFELSVTVGYESDPEVVISILRKILNAHALILRVPAPSVRLENFSQHGADYFVRAFVSIRKVREQWEVAGDVRVALYKAFREKGIVFPYPRLIMYNKNTQPDDASTFFKVKFDDAPDDGMGRRVE